jgi:membrane-bound serine protease (ClpP class)
MKLWLPLVLQALSFAVAFAEVMLPSFGLLALLCAGLFGWSWVLLAKHAGRAACIGFGVADLILIPIFIRLAFAYLGRSPISHQTSLGHGSGLEAKDKELQRHVGATARADSPLRPSGRIRIGDDTFEAQTHGEFVDRGEPVKVVSVAGSRFTVEKLNP